MIKIGIIEKIQELKNNPKKVTTNNTVTEKSQVKKKKVGHLDIKARKDALMGDGGDSNKITYEDCLPKKMKTAMDWYNTKMYFGIMMPVKQPKLDENLDVIGEENVPKLTWVFDTKKHQIVTPIFKKQNNILVEEELTMDRRWNMNKLQQWVHASKAEPYKTLSPFDLFNQIKAQFKKYVWFDDEQYYNILPLWIIGTYCYELFQAYPYINLWGLKNTGKTKVMQLSGILSFNSQVFINMSVASLFRIIEKDNPTLFIDEAENLWQPQQKGDDETSEIVACLNAGWMKGSQVPRVEKIDGKQQVIKFNVYCPKMLASIKGLKGALDTRCIRIIMVRPIGQPVSQLWFDQDDIELLALRDEIYPFILENWGVIKAYYSGGNGVQVENTFGMDNRDWQIWKPILCMANLVSPELVKEIGEWAAEECEMSKEEDINDDDWDVKIFKALLGLVKSEKVERYYMRDIMLAVDDEFIDKTYFDNYKNQEVKTYLPKRPSNAFVGRLLNKVGFRKDKFKSGERGYWFSKKRVQTIVWSVSRISDLSVRSVQPSKECEVLIGIIDSLKDSLKKLPTFGEIQVSIPALEEVKLTELLKYMEDKKMIYQPRPDQYEVLK